MSQSKLPLKPILAAICGISIFAVCVLIVTMFHQSSSVAKFDDQAYLEAPHSLNGELIFKARVVSQIGRSADRSTLRLSVLETTSGEPLELVVVIADSTFSEAIYPGQLFLVSVNARLGNMIATKLEKF